jgi:hypothetical protein
VARHVLTRDGRGHRPDGAGEEAVAVDDRRELVANRGIDRLAAVQRLEPSELLRLGLDPLGDAQERGGAFGRRRAGPRLERLARASGGGIDLLGRRLGQLEDRLARARVQDRLGRLGAGGEFAVDEKVRVHWVSSLRDSICRNRPCRCRRA